VWVVQPFPLFSSIATGHMSVVNTMLQVLLHIDESFSLLLFRDGGCVGGFDPLSDAYGWEFSFVEAKLAKKCVFSP
jgi:hypothetical protein